jgi:hypothetical protein
MVTSFADFQANFGNFIGGSWLTHSALQFFNNGGTRLYIARVKGHESKAPQEIDFQKAFALLNPITDINLVAVLGISSPSMVSYGRGIVAACEYRKVDDQYNSHQRVALQGHIFGMLESRLCRENISCRVLSGESC